MEPAIFTSFDRGLTFAEAIDLIGGAGFRVVALDGYPAWSGYGTAAGRRRIAGRLARRDLRVEAVHAPFPEGDRLFATDEAVRAASVRWCRLALETAAEFGAAAVAVHLVPYGVNDPDRESAMVAQGRRSIAELARYAASLGVALALENGQESAYDRVLEALLAEFGDPVGLCFDTGHANVRRNGFALLEKYAARVRCFHIHDNTGRDTHVLPGEGDLDWEPFRALLAAHDFPGCLTIEAHPAKSSFRTARAFLAEAYGCAGRLLAG